MICFVPVPALLILTSGCTRDAGINRKTEAWILSSHSTLVPKMRKDKNHINYSDEDTCVVFKYIFLLD